ncbi:expressed unknown protein [Seminavis robusta]|uniref:Uncharacterized protein n=1 Tax=Seminavis robusta TaxID=568900 RepID=A0A9N8E7H4_9STRA|nr:expressed unknown protein [Seminavis robusta]|eukprot:Sro703_g190070.1 n/a (359) ;mRNA; r:6786-7862
MMLMLLRTWTASCPLSVLHVIAVLLVVPWKCLGFTAGPTTCISLKQSIRSLSPLAANDSDGDSCDETTKKKKKKQWIDKGVASYSDNFLLDFHNSAQNEYQSSTNGLKLWNQRLNQEEFTFLEWQDAFHRNGFSDFCPPMSSNLNCLVVGEDIAGQTAKPPEPKLPWEEESEAEITELRISTDAVVDVAVIEEDDEDQPPSDLAVPNNTQQQHAASTSASMIRTERVTTTQQQSQNPGNDSGLARPPATGQAAVYDCIIDQGLMEAVLVLDDEKAITELAMEAAFAIREHGIYVLVLAKPLSKDQKEWLQTSGIQAGLEWIFDLDGISDAKQNQYVSVARRFNTGEMPKVGRLSRYQV